MRHYLLVVCIAAGGGTASAQAPSHVQIELVSEQASIRPGEAFWLGLRVVMEPSWHTYWSNPGDSGMATTIRWDLPPGFTAGAIQWPVPRRIATPPVVSFGYEGEVLLLTKIEPDASVAAGPARFVAHATWVECHDVCIKGRADATLELPVKDEPAFLDPQWGQTFADAKAQLPVSLPQWSFRASNHGNKLILRATPPPDFVGRFSEVDFFPEQPGVVDLAAPQWVKQVGGSYMIELSRSQFAAQPPGQLRGVLVSRHGWGQPGMPSALRVDVPVEPAGR